MLKKFKWNDITYIKYKLSNHNSAQLFQPPHSLLASEIYSRTWKYSENKILATQSDKTLCRHDHNWPVAVINFPDANLTSIIEFQCWSEAQFWFTLWLVLFLGFGCPRPHRRLEEFDNSKHGQEEEQRYLESSCWVDVNFPSQETMSVALYYGEGEIFINKNEKKNIYWQNRGTANLVLDSSIGRAPEPPSQ